ncbi:MULTISPECIES: RidA family protein [Bordetella]|uniref:RidA family protein n=2 Tax=Bordetella TaxID=517 RepID=A0A261VIL6_9BORD|nr:MULTISPECIES: RidA family protein [Bordetella]MDM9559638.1 RidA family protein [Bordetella petrii]OZI73611.1 RidA family protein [Bordetella genomosp. 2]
MIEVVDTGIAKSKGPISGAVVAAGSRILYTAQVPKNPATGEIVAGDIEAQARQALSNLKQTVEAAGGSMANVAQVLIYLVDGADAPVMNRVYAEFFTPPYPNRATVVVKELLAPGMRIEMVAHAMLG